MTAIYAARPTTGRQRARRCQETDSLRSSITELGENTGRRSSHSGVGRMNSKPDVVTRAQAAGCDG